MTPVLVSGLSMGLRTRTKVILILVLALVPLLYILSSSDSSTGVPPLSSPPTRHVPDEPVSNPIIHENTERIPKVNIDAEKKAKAEMDKLEAKVVADVKAGSVSAKSSKLVPDDDVDAARPFISFLGGRLPKGITGRALDRVYEWANKAELADAAAREAYAAAIDAKAMLFISAATDLDDLIDRYWQTHMLHYNASVQSAAAERIREFLLDPTFAIAPSDISLLEPKKTPLCLIAAYEGQRDDFPEYATVLADSVAKNQPFADLHLFVHNVTKQSFPLNLQRPNVKVIDIAHVDPSYAYRGFAGFATDRLCKLFGRGTPVDPAMGWDETDEDCALLELRLAQFEGRGGRALDQLRGVWGRLFQDWVSSDRCESWGWIDVGTAVGDLSRWMNNTAIMDADLVTAHEGDEWRLYLRSSFAVHSYRRAATLVTDLWKRCSNLATLPALISTFENPGDWLSLTEGCYSHGALTAPGIRAVLAPWQLPSWTDTRLLILHDGRANYCVGENNVEVCRGWVRTFMQEQKKKEAKQIAEAVLYSKHTSSSYRTARQIFSSAPRMTRPGVISSGRKCADWIPSEYNLCLDDDKESSKRGDRAYIQTLQTNAETNVTSAAMVEYDVPSDGVGIEGITGRGVGETMIVRFLDWATKESKGKGKILPKVEKTWFYSLEKGSIQITAGKIMLHTVNGWW
ncbi:hypothetical protein SpCBS45565_g01265 [Spizellomyces sp. 'palustris']|nr:hypothetical protein SpCBS45565_g01265 [Spizellomyces sp. 'palustris']